MPSQASEIASLLSPPLGSNKYTPSGAEKLDESCTSRHESPETVAAGLEELPPTTAQPTEEQTTSESATVEKKTAPSVSPLHACGGEALLNVRRLP
jgi:hypothetical protein